MRPVLLASRIPIIPKRNTHTTKIPFLLYKPVIKFFKKNVTYDISEGFTVLLCMQYLNVLFDLFESSGCIKIAASVLVHVSICKNSIRVCTSI